MKRNYIHYYNIKLTHEDLPYYVVFDSVADVAEWLLVNSEARTYNAAKTGVYYVLENRMEHYRGFHFVADLT